MLVLNKFSIIILTRCDLRCKLCCEYVPQNKPFPDMTVDEEKAILAEIFKITDHINMIHLTGGGEPFLHPYLAEFVEETMKYSEKFDKLMLFTNCTIPVSDNLLSVLKKYKEKIIVQTSQYAVMPEREKSVLKTLQDNEIFCKVEKYYGDNQSFGGWVDFGKWGSYGRAPEELEKTFKNCSVTNVLKGNWRTRDGKVHWCSRSQRGMELGLLKDNPDDYVDLFDNNLTIDEKQRKFESIANKKYLSACDHCSGDSGTDDKRKRYPAAEQL